ncbi:unnamed protein product, partial [Brassica rapa]
AVAVRVCPSAHTGRPWLSSHIYQNVGPGLNTLALSVDSHTVTSVCVRVSVASTHRTSVCPSKTQDVRGCPCVSVTLHRRSRGCPAVHISTLVLGPCTLALPVTVW